MWGRYGVDLFVDGKIYRISEEVEETEENQDWGGKVIKLWGRRENIKVVEEGIKKLRSENNKIVEEKENRNEKGER